MSGNKGVLYNMIQLLVFILLLASCVCFATDTKEYKDVIYKETSNRPLCMDIKYVADGKKKPLILLIHGGGWVEGTKESMCNFALPFFDSVYKEGFVVASIEYRFLQEGGIIKTIEDCKSAVRFLRKRADVYEIDPGRIIACGHSAGAHLSSLLGLLPKEEKPSKVQGVLCFSGPLCFEDSEAKEYCQIMTEHLGLTDSKLKKIGDPFKNINKDAAKFMVIHGSADSIVDYRPTEKFVGKMREYGLYCDYILIDGDDHLADYIKYKKEIMNFLNSFKDEKNDLD